MQSKTNYELIIIGGGILGSAVAYYYKRDNPDKNVAVFEKNELCSGNTSLAAALISIARADKYAIPLSLETYRVIPELEEITGDKIPVRYNGAIHITTDEESEANLQKMLSVISEYAIKWETISANKARSMVKWLDCSRARGIVFIHNEAIIDPYLLCMSFANAAKNIGVEFYRHTNVKSLIRSGNDITGVITSDGIKESGCTVLAAGAWSVYLAYEAGISLPMTPVRSQYWISEIDESLFKPYDPVVIIPKAGFYARPLGNSLLFGIREPVSVYADPCSLPDNINRYPFSNCDGWNDLIESYEKIAPFFQAFGDIGIKNYVAGFSCYTPDNHFIIGGFKDITGLLLATGDCGAGISVAGGIGFGVAALAAGKSNPYDFSYYKPERFGTINPFSEEHMISCGLARSGKNSG